MSNKYECLIVVFKPELTLAFSEQSSKPILRMDNREFTDPTDRSWNCFYDWLRNASNRVLGVRLWLWNDLSNLVEHLGYLPYTRVGKEKKSIEVFFSDDRQYIDEFSKDQEFYENRILESNNHE